jgi:hypothetical protein
LPTFVVAIISLVRGIFIEILETSPRVKGKPEVVEFFDFVFCRGEGTELWDGITGREAGFGFEEGGPEFEEVAFGFFGGRFDVGAFVYGIELATFYWVRKRFKSYLSA